MASQDLKDSQSGELSGASTVTPNQRSGQNRQLFTFQTPNEELIARLKQYCTDRIIETKGFSGPSFFVRLRAENRKINVFLAQKLQTELEQNTNVAKVFSNIKAKRNEIIKHDKRLAFFKGFFRACRSIFTDGVFSKDLNKIIRDAQKANFKP